jgi:acetyl esterase
VLGPRERFEARFGRAISSLPGPAQRLIAGGGRVEVDGLELHHEMQLLLRTSELTGRKPFEQTAKEEGLPAARASIEGLTLQLSWPLAAVARREDVTIPGASGEIAGRLYVPHGAPDAGPLLVFFHAGGHVIGSNDSCEGVCRFLAATAGIRVLSADYRHAPEHVFPAAVDDALAAYRWAVAEADGLGADPRRIAVGGDSAGGNLAAVVAQQTRDDDPAPAFQLLIYPVTDMSQSRPSYDLFASGFLLTKAQMDWYRSAYTGDDPAVLSDVRASPLLAEDLSGLAPAFVMTGGFDPLRDEGEEYGRRLAEAGVQAVTRRYDGLLHGFANMTRWGSASREAMAEAAGALRLGLAAPALSPASSR